MSECKVSECKVCNLFLTLTTEEVRKIFCVCGHHLARHSSSHSKDTPSGMHICTDCSTKNYDAMCFNFLEKRTITLLDLKKIEKQLTRILDAST